MAKEARGFASVTPDRQREIASRGGRAAHEKGAAHEWTSEEARAAGRKGGMARQRKRFEESGERAPLSEPASSDVVGLDWPSEAMK